MLRQIVLHTFSSGIYTMPLPSCFHLHISIALSPPPTVLNRSRKLICWPSCEAALIAGQRMAAKNYYKNVGVRVRVYVLVGVSDVLCPFPIQPTPSFTLINCIFTVHRDIMESVCLWKFQMKMYIHKFHYKKFQTCTQNTGYFGYGAGESTWIITS